MGECGEALGWHSIGNASDHTRVGLMAIAPKESQDDYPTKEDLRTLRVDLERMRVSISSDVRNALDEALAHHSAEMNQRIDRRFASLKAEMDDHIDRLETSINANFDRLEALVRSI